MSLAVQSQLRGEPTCSTVDLYI